MGYRDGSLGIHFKRKDAKIVDTNFIEVLQKAKAKKMSAEDIMSEAEAGYGGNTDDAYQLGFQQGRAELAEAVLIQIDKG